MLTLPDADSEDASAQTPGEAVLTGASTYVAQAKISREQVRSQNKETLLEIINNEELSEEEKQSAVESMVTMTDRIEKEAAAESLLEAKGFENVVVNLNGDTADVMVPTADLESSQLAQIEDAVKRKTGVEPQNIVITRWMRLWLNRIEDRCREAAALFCPGLCFAGAQIIRGCRENIKI